MKINKKYKIVEATYQKLIGAIFECVIINKGESVEPKWFKEFRKENDARWTKQEEFNKAQLEFNQHVSEFIKQQMEVNKRNDEFIKQQVEVNKRVEEFIKQQLEFNKYVLDVFKRNSLK